MVRSTIKISSAFVTGGRMYITGAPVKPLPEDFSTGLDENVPEGQVRFSVRKSVLGLMPHQLLANALRNKTVKVDFQEHTAGDLLGDYEVKEDGWHVEGIEGIVEQVPQSVLTALILAESAQQVTSFSSDSEEETTVPEKTPESNNNLAKTGKRK